MRCCSCQENQEFWVPQMQLLDKGKGENKFERKNEREKGRCRNQKGQRNANPSRDNGIVQEMQER